MKGHRNTALWLMIVVPLLYACKTKSELRREQDLERLRQEVSAVKGEKADVEVVTEELKTDIVRLANLVEEQGQYNRQQHEEMRKELAATAQRIQALEQRAVNEEIAARQPPPPPPLPKGFEAGKKLFEEGKYEEAADVLRPVAKGRKSEEARKPHCLLAKAHFANRDFATAALEFGEYKKLHAKDPLIPNAIYRQANAFRSMGKGKEAKLFYQELVDKFPKSNLASKAKQEIKKLK